MKKSSVLLLITDGSASGAPRQVALLAKGLLAQYEVTLACPPGYLADSLRDTKVNIHEIDYGQSLLKTRHQLRQLFLLTAPAIIHCHGVRAGIIGRAVARQYRTVHETKIVYTEHLWTNDFHLPNQLRERFQLSLLRYLAHTTDATIAVSRAVKQFIELKQLADTKVEVIYGAIEPIAAAKPVAQPIIGTIGRLTWVKGIDRLIEALAIIVKEIPEIRCKIAGSGPDLPQLRSKAEALGVGSRIEWLGEIENPEAFYRELQIYVQPSLSESFGMAPLEAMSAGIPVIAAKTGALPELIDDGVTGLLFTTPEELATKIIRLITNEATRSHIASLGQQHALSFTTQKMVAAHSALYQKLLDHRA